MTDSRSREAQSLWDNTVRTQSDISPASEENFRIFTAAYAVLPSRLKLPPDAAVLDLGCGTGFAAHVFSGRQYRVTGVDLSPRSVALAQKRNPHAQFVVGNMTEVPLPDASQDAVVAITSLEFCENKTRVLSEVRRLLRPGGVFYLEVRNASFPPLAFPSAFQRLFEKAGWLTPVPLKGFRDWHYQEWKSFFAEQGWVCQKEQPSLRPWNYGALGTRLKQSLIAAVRFVLPMRFHYMNAFLLRPAG